MTHSPSIVVAGIDVGKSKLDVHMLDLDLDRQFDNTKTGRRALRNWLLKHGVSRAVFEPTGRYHRNLHQDLADAGLETVLVNPLRSRRFAEATGQLAKNDRVDASMLARFGLLRDLQTTPPRQGNLRLLSDLLALRRKLVEQLGALRKLCAELDPEAAASPSTTLDALKADIADCDRRMRACIAAAGLSRRDAIIQSIPGFGPVNAACLCADMPELGSLGRRQTASLLGLAPFDRDSGQPRGGRSIRGGAPSPAICSTWRTCPRSVASPPPKPATSASPPTASPTRSPLLPSCVGLSACSTPSSAKTASGRPSRQLGPWRPPRETTLDQRPANCQYGENIASRSPSVITFPPHVA